MAALAFAFIISFFGIVMGVLLLKGTQQVRRTTSKLRVMSSSDNNVLNILQKRVSFIKAWLIYGLVAVAVSIFGIILNAAGSSSVTVGTAVVSGILGIGINVFSLIVVYIHMKEINAGVFIP